MLACASKRILRAYSTFRIKAIFKALPGDIVLIAGKGHEDYQIIGEKIIKFDDRECARQELSLKLGN